MVPKPYGVPLFPGNPLLTAALRDERAVAADGDEVNAVERTAAADGQNLLAGGGRPGI
jgi:hypothetical protein